MNFGSFLVLGIGAMLLIIGLRGSYSNIWQSFGGGIPDATIGGMSSGNWTVPPISGTNPPGTSLPPTQGFQPFGSKQIPSITTLGLSSHKGA